MGPPSPLSGGAGEPESIGVVRPPMRPRTPPEDGVPGEKRVEERPLSLRLRPDTDVSMSIPGVLRPANAAGSADRAGIWSVDAAEEKLLSTAGLIRAISSTRRLCCAWIERQSCKPRASFCALHSSARPKSVLILSASFSALTRSASDKMLDGFVRPLLPFCNSSFSCNSRAAILGSRSVGEHDQSSANRWRAQRMVAYLESSHPCARSL